MAWTSMHLAVGMTCAGAAGGLVCLFLRRGWRWLPAAMTVGGIWALVPDLPRVFREDFPSLGLASTLGSKSLERWLHSIGDLFFFHQSLDIQPKEYALLGLFTIVLLYNFSILMLMFMEDRARNSVGNRAWRAHEPYVRRYSRRAHPGVTPPVRERDDGPYDQPVIHRIRSSHLSRPDASPTDPDTRQAI